MLMNLVSASHALTDVKEAESGRQRNHKYNRRRQFLIRFVTLLTFCVLVVGNCHVNPLPVKGQTYHEVSPLHLSTNTALSYDPQMTVSSNEDIFIVWTGAVTAGSGDSNIYYSKSIDGGKTFAPPVILSTLAYPGTGPIISPGIQQEARIATSGSNVYVIWSDYSAGPAELVFVKSNDSGTTFSSPISLGTVFAAAGETRLSASKNNVYAVWIGSADDVHAGSILSRSSNNFGASFGETTSVSGPGVASMPEIATAPGRDSVYITWFNTTIREDGTVLNNDILFSKSPNGGHNYSKPKNLSQSPNQFSVRPHLYVISAPDNTTSSNLAESSSKKGPEGNRVEKYKDRVYLAWLESGARGNVDIGDIFFSMSLDGGTSFTSPKQLSNNTQGSIQPNTDPQIVASADGKNVYVVWSHVGQAGQEEEIVNAAGTEAYDMYDSNMIAQKKEISNGNTSTNNYLQNNEALAGVDTLSPVRYQRLGVSADQGDKRLGDNITIDPQAISTNEDLSSRIFMSISHDGGRNFSKPITISESNGFSIDPSIMILPNSTSNVVTMWTDNSTNDLGIFNIVLKSSLTNYSEDGNAYGDGQTNVLLTPGSILRPQMAAIQSSNANDTLDPENERKDIALSLIIAGVEAESGSGYYGIFLTRVSL
jgi:hypothetical protein